MAQGTTALRPVGLQVAQKRVTISGAAGPGFRSLGFFPAGAVILAINTAVRTVFNGTTPNLSIGTAILTPDNLVADAGALITTLGMNVATLLGTAAVLAADTELFAELEGVGMTLGDADVIVRFSVPNETPG